MLRNSLVVLLAVVALVMIVGQAEATTISGSLITCPGEDPIVNAPIKMYVNETFVGTTYTNANGVFSVMVNFWGLEYGDVITVSLGPAEFPEKVGICPQQASETYTGVNIHFPDLEFACGFDKHPPCPQM